VITNRRQPLVSRAVLCADIESGTAEEHSIARDERQAPANRGRPYPQVGVVRPLVQPVADEPALVLETRDRVGRVDIDRQHADTRDWPVDRRKAPRPQPAFSAP
jgi:hypothetical protein